MTFEQRERIRRRRRRKKAFARTVRSVALLPSKLPHLSDHTFVATVKACEIVGLAFVVVVICSMLNPSTMLTVLRTVSALAFFFLFFL